MSIKLNKMETLTDSREILNQGNNIISKYIILFLLGIFIFFVIILSILKKDIGVKISGFIEPSGDITTISSEFQGSITNIHIEDGQKVKENDILIEIDNQDLKDKKHLLQQSLTDIKQLELNYNKLIKSIDDGKNYFDKNNLYEEKFYYEYLYFESENKSHEDDDIKQQKYIDKLKNDIDLYNLCLNSINDNVNYIDKTHSKFYEINKYLSDIKLLNSNIISKTNDLNEEIDIIEIQKIKDEISKLNLDIETLKNNSIYDIKKEIEVLYTDLNNQALKEHSHDNSYAKVGILEKAQNLKSDILQYESQIQELDELINKSTIKSNHDGIVNLDNFFKNGDFIQLGQPICSIVPEETPLIGYFFIPTNEIDNINIGDELKLEIEALDKKDYGLINSNIKTISTKSKSIEKDSPESFYIITADLSENYLEDKKGNKSYLKSGMNIDGIIIKEKYSYLKYILKYLFNI